ncbi:MAG: glutathione synthase [Legionellales bacterium]|nr:glutathione synthase [Legionellales bacterium]
MNIQLGVVMDSISQIDIAKDSTLAMLLAAQQRGCQLVYLEPTDIFYQNGTVFGQMRALQVQDDAQHWFTLSTLQEQPLASLDVLLLRKDPPFNMEYIYLTYLLELAQQQGLKVVNDPRSVRDANEKLFAAQFPHCCPPTLVTRDPARLRAFIGQYPCVIAKPLDGMGGQSIFRIEQQDPNAAVILETLTHQGHTTVMLQQYLPEIMTTGDKRILLINGEPTIDHGLARMPQPGDVRGNLAAGGRGIAQPLTERDRWLCQQVGPTLRQKNLMFVGLDVIGDYITEINVTSPTCIRQLDAQCGADIGGDFIEFILTLLD